MAEELPAEFEDKVVEVENKHLLFGFFLVLSSALLISGGLMYYREHLKIRRHERLLELGTKLVNTLTQGETSCSSQSSAAEPSSL